MRSAVFFKELLNRPDISVGGRVLWSWLISEAMLGCKGGVPYLSSWLSNHNGKVRVKDAGFGSLPETIGFPRATFYRKVYELRDAGIWVDGEVLIPVEALRGGYFELKEDSRFVSVEERVMYSWLCDRCVWANTGVIWVSNPYMAKVLGMSLPMVRKHKSRMYGCGLLEVRHARRGHFYTGVPALYSTLGTTPRANDVKTKTIKVIFDDE